MPLPTPEDEALWIEYLDWCSIQVLGRIAELPPEGMWLLDQASQESGEGAGDGAGVDDRMLPRIRRIALHVFRSLELPDFDAWRAMSPEERGAGSASPSTLAGTE